MLLFISFSNSQARKVPSRTVRFVVYQTISEVDKHGSAPQFEKSGKGGGEEEREEKREVGREEGRERERKREGGETKRERSADFI